MASVSTRCSLASSRVNTNTTGKKSAHRRKEGICRFATWNVRSLLNESGPVETALVGSSRSSKKFDDRRVDVAVNELKRLDIEVAGFQETRWFGTDTYRVGGAVVLASGRPLPRSGDAVRRGEGVAIVLRGRALQAWRAGGEQWRAVSSRIAVAQLQMTFRKRLFVIHVVSCYAPTFRSSRADKDAFFAELQGVLRDVGRHDKYVLLGDFNARVGTRCGEDDDDAWADVRGPCGLGRCNDAGKELLEFLNINNSTICNTWFTKKPLYKQSWQHPQTKQWHMIDFAIVHQRDRHLCQDCRVVCAADCGSDHRMVCLSFKLPNAKFRRPPSSPRRLRFDVSQLKPSPIMSHQEREAVVQRVKEFQQSVTSSLEDQVQSSVEERWCALRDSLTNAGCEHLGYTRRRQPDWFSASQAVLEPLFKDRRLCYNRWVGSKLRPDYISFKIARSQARAAVRRAKNGWLADVAEQAEATRNHGGSAWSSIRAIQRCFHGLRPTPAMAVKKENGQACTSTEELSARWQRHFTNVLNVESVFEADVFPSLRVRPVRNDLADVPTEDELARAIARLSNNKAAGESGILPEMVQHAGPAFATSLFSLVCEVWKEASVPQAWRDAELVPIPKKGDLSNCDNWRGIALLDVVGKVIGRLIQNRLQGLAELELADAQCGFRQGRSCTDQIFSITQHIEKLYEHRTQGFLAFIDLRKAYDSVSREALWCGLEVLGVPPRLVQLISSFHTNMSAKVRVGSLHTGQIPVKNGLRQGCTMAPALFNLFFELVLEKWRAEMADEHPDLDVAFRFNINGNLYNSPRTSHSTSSAPDLEFADDAVLITSSRVAVVTALTVFVKVAASFGLTVNFAKTKVMGCGVGLSPEDRLPLSVLGKTIEYVESFVYLGSLLSPDARSSAEVERRLACASRAFGALQCVFQDKDLSVRTKRLVYKACVLSTLLYGAECWVILRRDEIRLDAFHHRCLRAILGVSRWHQQLHHVSNKDLRQRWGDIGLVSDMLRRQRLQWLGHVSRMPDDRLPKKLLFGWLPQRRPAHGPRLRWKDRVTADLKQLGVTDWYQVSHDRAAWRTICHSVVEPQPSASISCEHCKRTFKSKAGLCRHKCIAEQQLPVCEQPGSRQCSICHRWFRSAGGLSVHRCLPVANAPQSTSQPEQTDHTTTLDRHPASNLECCQYHCEVCARCFKSRPGFHRHNCHRGKRPLSSSREQFQQECGGCKRRFSRVSDLKRHKCRMN